MKSVIFWDVTPCSLVAVYRHLRGKFYLRLQGRIISQANRKKKAGCVLLGFLSTLKMEAVCSSETSTNFYHTIRHHIPEDSTLKSTNITILQEEISTQLVCKYNATNGTRRFSTMFSRARHCTTSTASLIQSKS
jgi:hypothetical protein